MRKKEQHSLPICFRKIRHVVTGILPCENYKSETGCMYGKRCHFRHVEAEETPSKKSKNGVAKGSVALFKESSQLGCVSRDSHPRKSILRKEGKLGFESRRQLLQGHEAPTKKYGKERVHREGSFKSVNLMSAILALRSLRRGHKR